MIALPEQIKKITDPSIHLSTNSSSNAFTSNAHVSNLGVTFVHHLSFSNHISNRSRYCREAATKSEASRTLCPGPLTMRNLVSGMHFLGSKNNRSQHNLDGVILNLHLDLKTYTYYYVLINQIFTNTHKYTM